MAFKLGSGGGGGGTYEDHDVGALGNGSSTTVTHASVPLTSMAFKVEAQGTLPGASTTTYLPPGGAGDGWSISNLSWYEPGITWTNDGLVGGQWTGHFSKALDGTLSRGIHLTVEGSAVAAGMVVLGGTGTGVSDIVVDDNLPTGTVERVYALTQTQTGSPAVYIESIYDGATYRYPNMTDFLAPLNPALAFDPSVVSSWSNPPRGYVYGTSTVSWVGCFLSKDGGSTWWGWDTWGSDDWISGVDPENFTHRLDYGFRFPPDGYWTTIEYLSSAPSWTDMSLPIWTSWVADATSILIYFWLMTSFNTVGTTLYNVSLDYLAMNYEAEFEVGGLVGGYGGGPQIQIRRVSDTSFEVKNSSGTGIVDLRLRVYTAD